MKRAAILGMIFGAILAFVCRSKADTVKVNPVRCDKISAFYPVKGEDAETVMCYTLTEYWYIKTEKILEKNIVYYAMVNDSEDKKYKIIKKVPFCHVVLSEPKKELTLAQECHEIGQK